MRRGTLYRSACRHTVRVCASTPENKGAAQGVITTKNKHHVHQPPKSSRCHLLDVHPSLAIFLTVLSSPATVLSPAEASRMATAPSSTLRERSTSMVKSTWPGVSTRLMQCSAQGRVMAAEVMVMPAKG